MNTLYDVIVLAAGFGTRMKSLTAHCPKPLLPLWGKPMLAHILDHIAGEPIHQILINSHYLAEQIRDFVTSYQKHYPHPIRCFYESEILGSGGALLNLKSSLQDQPFFVINGDVFWKKTEKEGVMTLLPRVWSCKKMDALLAVIPKEKAWGYEGNGDFFMDDRGRLGPSEGREAPFVFAGVHMMSPLLFGRDLLRPFSCWTFWNKALAQKRLFGALWEEPWFHIGTEKAYQAVPSGICNPPCRHALRHCGEISSPFFASSDG